jgi:hypothetical protein
MLRLLDGNATSPPLSQLTLAGRATDAYSGCLAPSYSVARMKQSTGGILRFKRALYVLIIIRFTTLLHVHCNMSIQSLHNWKHIWQTPCYILGNTVIAIYYQPTFGPHYCLCNFYLPFSILHFLPQIKRQLELLVAEGKGERCRCRAKLKQKWQYVRLWQDLQRYVQWRRSRCCRQDDT